MKLYIDTSQRDKITIGLDAKRYSADSRVEKAQKLLPFIAEILEKEKSTIKDIAEIEVVEGPGSFTGLRVGITIANTIGWTLGIPVNGKRITSTDIIEPKYT